MKTIEIAGTNVKLNKKRVKKLIGLLPKRSYYHFLFEPELIIRLPNENTGSITRYLDKRNIKYKLYNYPLTKNRFGEDKKSVMYKYRQHFQPLMGIQSSLALERNKKEDLRIIERYNHTFLNTMGYDWISESIIYSWLAGGRIAVIKKYDAKTPIAFLLCFIILKLMAFNIILMKGLK